MPITLKLVLYIQEGSEGRIEPQCNQPGHTFACLPPSHKATLYKTVFTEKQ